MDLLLVIIVLVFVLLLLLKPNIFLTKAILEWPTLSSLEKFIYISLLWVLPGAGHYVAYKKSCLDKNFTSGSDGSTSAGSGSDGSGGGCGDGGC